MSERFFVLLLAVVLDRLVGDPDWLWRRLPHPVVLFGQAISFFDKRFNRRETEPHRLRLSGLVSILLLLFLAAGAGLAISHMADHAGWFAPFIVALIAAIFIAQKSLSDHVGAVVDGLRDGGLEGGRRAVSMIVGRDPQTLDEAGVCRAAIESLAENFSDGIVAPVFWFAIGGLPGLFAYKMLNTADSMIGHKNETYLHFGRAAAKLDDVANWIPARLSALLLIGAALLRDGWNAARDATNSTLADAGLHRSPNAGWPESAMAGALGLALGGARVYHGERVMEASLNGAGRRNAGSGDVARALKNYETALDIMTLCVISGLAFSFLSN